MFKKIASLCWLLLRLVTWLAVIYGGADGILHNDMEQACYSALVGVMLTLFDLYDELKASRKVQEALHDDIRGLIGALIGAARRN